MQALSLPLDSWWDQRAEETKPQWAERIQHLLMAEVDRKKAEGNSSAQILLRTPPEFLRRLYSIIFSCSEAQAAEQITWEKQKYGFIQVLGQVVVSDPSASRPEIQVMGTIQNVKRKLKAVRSQFGGGLIRKAQK